MALRGGFGRSYRWGREASPIKLTTVANFILNIDLLDCVELDFIVGEDMSLKLNLAIALRLLDSMVEGAKEREVLFSGAVVDPGGELISMVRMDGASPNSSRMCVNKAYTAVKWIRDTKTLKDKLFDHSLGGEQRDIAWFGDPRYTPIWGGVLLRDPDGVVLGGIGGSGGTPAQDEEIVRLAADRFHGSRV